MEGYRCLSGQGTEVELVSMKLVYYPELIEVYNIEVKDYHCYPIGNGNDHENLIAHNKCVGSFIKLNPLGLDFSVFSFSTFDAPATFPLPQLDFDPPGIPECFSTCVTPNGTAYQTTSTIVGHGFTDGTTVLMADGSTKSIEELAVGEIVMAVPDDDVNAVASGCTVTDIYQTTADTTVLLRFVSENGEILEIRAGEEQLFCLVDGSWVTASELEVNQMCVTANGLGLLLIDKTVEEAEYTLYVITVENNHTFYVVCGNDDALLVHNSEATWHHLLPKTQEFAENFKKAGINVHDAKFGILLVYEDHTKAGDSLHSNGWNPEWKRFFQENSDATALQILDQLESMKNDPKYSIHLQNGYDAPVDYNKWYNFPQNKKMLYIMLPKMQRVKPQKLLRKPQKKH